MEIRGKKALVTGGAKRIGREIALTLAKHGADIILHYNHSGKEAETTALEIKSHGVQCELAQADFEDADDVKRLAHDLVLKHNFVPILINSASLYYRTPIAQVKEADWDALMDVNLKSPFLLSAILGLAMVQNGGGKIINIADWSGLRPYKSFLPYCASKGGLITMTRSLARDLAPTVYANAIAPGPMLPPEDMSETERAEIAKLTALGRWGQPQDIANAVVFLLENDFINGTVLGVDGGRSLV